MDSVRSSLWFCRVMSLLSHLIDLLIKMCLVGRLYCDFCELEGCFGLLALDGNGLMEIHFCPRGPLGWEHFGGQQFPLILFLVLC